MFSTSTCYGPLLSLYGPSTTTMYYLSHQNEIYTPYPVQVEVKSLVENGLTGNGIRTGCERDERDALGRVPSEQVKRL